VKVAPHHVPGTSEHDLSQRIRPSPSYTPQKAWPEDCTVQWGHGIVPATPFFEAFVPGTFIRGEGATIEEAEAKAFAQYEREGTCEHHWGRQRPGGTLYTNGAGWCRKCRAFRSGMFPSIYEFGKHRQPLSPMEEQHLDSLENDHELNDRMDALYPGERAERLKMKRILRLRKNLYGSA